MERLELGLVPNLINICAFVPIDGALCLSVGLIAFTVVSRVLEGRHGESGRRNIQDGSGNQEISSPEFLQPHEGNMASFSDHADTIFRNFLSTTTIRPY